MNNYLNGVMVFSDQKNYRKSFIISLIIVLLPTFLSLVFCLIFGSHDLGTVFYVVGVSMLTFVVLIAISGKLYANNSSFIYEEGCVYKITHFPGEAGSRANTVRAAGSLSGNDAAGALAAGTILLESKGVREEQQDQLVVDSEFRHKLYTTEYSMQLTKINSMKKYRNGYKIKSNCRWNYGGKIRDGKHTFYIFPGYNDYEKLVECFKSLMD